MTRAADPRIGTDLGPYRIEAVIGRGGMGVVYRAEQLGLARKVALKILAPVLVDDEAFRQRFLRESQMAAAIDHPNILPIYEAGEVDGVYSWPCASSTERTSRPASDRASQAA